MFLKKWQERLKSFISPPRKGAKRSRSEREAEVEVVEVESLPPSKRSTGAFPHPLTELGGLSGIPNGMHQAPVPATASSSARASSPSSCPSRRRMRGSPSLSPTPGRSPPGPLFARWRRSTRLSPW